MSAVTYIALQYWNLLICLVVYTSDKDQRFLLREDDWITGSTDFPWCGVNVSANVFDIFWLWDKLFTCAICQNDHMSACASWTVCLTNPLWPEHFVPEPFPSQERTTDMDHVAFIDFLAGLKQWFQTFAGFFMLKRKEAVIHSYMYLLSWGLQKFMHFSSICFGKDWCLIKAWLEFRRWPHTGWSFCPAAIILICHLLTE